MRPLRNIAALYGLQVGQYVVPLLLTPYLARTLGVAQFGALGVAAGIVAYFTMIVDWGFSFTAVQKVAFNRTDLPGLRKLIWDVVLARLLLGIPCSAILVILAILFPTLGSSTGIILATGLGLASSIFSMGWFLQGVERMGTYAWVSLVGRFLSLPLTFFFVRNPDDAWIAAAILSGTGLVSTIAGIIMAARFLPILPVYLSFRDARRQLGDGWHLFLSTGAINLYTTSNIVILGALAGPVAAGYFNGAERIKRVVQGAVAPLSTAMYPRINNMMVHNRDGVWQAMRTMLIVQGGLTLVMSIALLFLARWITLVFLGPAFAGAVPTVQWMAAVPFLVGVSNVLGINMMIPLGMKRSLMWITLLGGAVNLALIVPLSLAYGSAGAAASVVIVEAMVTIIMAIRLIAHRDEIRGLRSVGGEVSDFVALIKPDVT